MLALAYESGVGLARRGVTWCYSWELNYLKIIPPVSGLRVGFSIYILCVPLLACVLVWDVHEQVCVAAMDCGDMLTAKVC